MLETDALEADEIAVDLEEFRSNCLAAPLSLAEIIPLLASPDTGLNLKLADDGRALTAKSERFPIIDGLPFLFPAAALDFIGSARIEPDLDHAATPILQYFLMSSIKQSPDASNSEHDDIWYRRHLHRARQMLSCAHGSLLDVGCDDPELSRAMCPPQTSYVGLDPLFGDRENFRVVGMSEFLPFADNKFDNILFNTSLDHVFDYHRAIDEASRVLKPGGRLFLATLLWKENAELIRDTVHFHHFRPYEIEGVLCHFEIESARFYNWKSNVHRYGAYIVAQNR